MTRILTYLGGFAPTFWLGVVALLLALNGVTYCKGRSDGKALEARKWEAAQAKADKAAGEANVAAAEARASDAATNTKAEEARNEAIAQNPDDPYRALACQRLRQAGKHAAAASAGCGSGN